MYIYIYINIIINIYIHICVCITWPAAIQHFDAQYFVVIYVCVCVCAHANGMQMYIAYVFRRFVGSWAITCRFLLEIFHCLG